MFNLLSIRSRYLAHLESELVRLRAENRALLNSLLGTAGFAPLDPAPQPAAPINRPRRRSWLQLQSHLEHNSTIPQPPTPHS